MLFKRILKIFLTGSVVIFLMILILLPHILPGILENVITDKVIRETGFKNFHINIRSIGLSGIDTGEIKLGNTASVDSVHIDYHPGALLQKKTDRIHISGLVVRAKFIDSHIEFPDADITRMISVNTNNKSQLKMQQTGSETALAPVFLPDKIFISNSSVILNLKDKTFVLPFNMTATMGKTGKSASIMLQIFPFGERMDIALTADFKTGIKHVEIKADSFCFSQADKLISMYFPKIHLTGKSAIKISKQKDSVWVVSISHVGVQSPFKGQINQFIVNVRTMGGSVFVSGSFAVQGSSPASRASTDNHDPGKSVQLMSPVKIDYSGDYEIKREKKNSWHFSLKARNAAVDDFLLESAGKVMHMGKPVFDLGFKGSGLQGKGWLTGTCLKGEGKYKNIRLSFSKLKLTGKSDFNFTRTGRGLHLHLQTESRSIKLMTDDFYANFPGTKCFTTLDLDRNFTPEFTVRPVIHNAMLKGYTPQIQIKGIDFEIPVVFPFNGGNQNGRKLQPGIFSMGKISFNGQNMGNINGRIIQNGDGGRIDGTASITGLTKQHSKGFKIHFRADGKLKADNGITAGLKFNSDKTNISSDELNRAWLAPDSDIHFHFSSMVKGNIKLNNHHLNTSLNVDITDGDLSFESENIQASGISTSLKFDDLPTFRSAPGQVLLIDKISSNDIKISKGIIKYSIESMHSFLIENAAFNWCDGRVSTGSMRFSPGKDIYSIILYCDRLKLSQILQQVGSFKAEGNGSLNGRIPVHYAKGNLSFDNGFLFSTPGLGGKIKIQDTEALTAGIPLDSPEFAQIDLAREALKNYKYKWAKLDFNTGKDDLVVKMEFDGGPAKILPFEYKRALGRFVRVDVTSPGSHFQGMRIDVNLKLPFNRVMKFGGRLNKLLNGK